MTCSFAIAVSAVSATSVSATSVTATISASVTASITAVAAVAIWRHWWRGNHLRELRMLSLTDDFLDHHWSTVTSTITATIASVSATVWVISAQGRAQGTQAENGQCKLTAEFGEHFVAFWSVFDFVWVALKEWDANGSSCAAFKCSARLYNVRMLQVAQGCLVMFSLLRIHLSDAKRLIFFSTGPLLWGKGVKFAVRTCLAHIFVKNCFCFSRLSHLSINTHHLWCAAESKLPLCPNRDTQHLFNFQEWQKHTFPSPQLACPRSAAGN